MSGYEFYLSRLSQDVSPAVTAGGSGYFSTPQPGLDPRLFVGTTFKPEVREWVLHTLYNFWRKKFRRPESWSTVWAAGSGISYQWAADRGNGDLDILIGVDFPEFYAANQSYVGLSESEVADIFNSQFHAELWPQTAHWNGFEVTFYVNDGATDIRSINPYAAYDITHNRWTVKPPQLPQNPRSLYPSEYWKAVDAEQAQAKSLVGRYSTLQQQRASLPVGSPGWTNSVAAMRLVTDQAKALFDSIHLGRKNAFGPGGSGYGDYYNFRWQAHKEAGTVEALRSLSGLSDDAHKHADLDLYGEPIKSATEALTQAALWNRRG